MKCPAQTQEYLHNDPNRLMMHAQKHEQEKRELNAQMSDMTKNHDQTIEQLRGECAAREADFRRQLDEVCRELRGGGNQY